MSKISVFLATLVLAVAVRSVNGCGECVCASGSYEGYGMNRAEASRAASSQCGFTRLCDARKGCTCKLMMSDCLSSVDCEDIPSSMGSHTYKCTARCSGASRSCLHGPVPPPGGEGDPHMTGFDGTRFAFHGEHAHNYLLFGRKGGDSLVATMRSMGQKMLRGGNYMRTFFDEFSVQSNSDDKINVALGRQGCVSPRKWCPQITVNGKTVSSYHANGVRVAMTVAEDKDDVVSVETRDSTFSIIAKRLMEDEKHLDVHIKLNRAPSKDDRYTGVLGVTLNRKLGRVVHTRFAAWRDPVALEMSLRKSFEVVEKFPVKKSAALSIDGIIRVPSRVMDAPEGCQLVAFATA